MVEEAGRDDATAPPAPACTPQSGDWTAVSDRWIAISGSPCKDARRSGRGETAGKYSGTHEHADRKHCDPMDDKTAFRQVWRHWKCDLLWHGILGGKPKISAQHAE